MGIVEVPDDRLWQLSKLSNSKKTIPAVVEFVDIAGLVKKGQVRVRDSVTNSSHTYVRQMQS